MSRPRWRVENQMNVTHVTNVREIERATRPDYRPEYRHGGQPQAVTVVPADRMREGKPITEVMGASFRNVGQILALAGCDLLTISPDLLAQLQASEAPVVRQLVPATDVKSPEAPLSEAAFRYALNDDAMATEKLAEGIRAFAVDAGKLDALIEAQR